MGITQQIGASSIIKPGVIDNTASRPASPYEGQVIFQKDTDQLLVWNGTAWVMFANANQPPGLQLVKTDTITSGNSKEITSAFSSDFTNYKIILSNLKLSTVANVTMRMGTTSTGVYYYGGLSRNYGSATTNGEQGAGAAQWFIGCIGTSTESASAIIELHMPNLVQVTSFMSLASDPRTGGAGARNYSGYINNTTQYTSFSLLGDAGATFSSCDISVYGYRNS